MQLNRAQKEALIDLLWDYLLKKVGDKSRVRTSYGEKTKEGLTASIETVLRINESN